MPVPMEAPPARTLAPDVQRLLRLTRWLPALETLPVPIARALYDCAALLFNPRHRNLAWVQKREPNLLLFEPKTATSSRAVHLFIHGGGWTLGTPRSYRSYGAWLACRTGSRVYALDYRRAPEHPYPAALDDCVAAYCRLRQQLPADQVICVLGDSAGGQLSLGLCYRLRAMQVQLPAALMLHYPVATAPGQTRSYQNFAEGLFLTRSMMQWFWAQYQPPQAHPEVSLLRWTNYDWLPPVTLCLARHDVLFDEGFSLAQVLHSAGVLQSLHIEQDLPHAYMNFMSCPSVMTAMERQLQSFSPMPHA